MPHIPALECENHHGGHTQKLEKTGGDGRRQSTPSGGPDARKASFFKLGNSLHADDSRVLTGGKAMSSGKGPTEDGQRDPLVVEANRYRKEREKGYRERALKLFPSICARCGREFSGKRRRQLTVHHKDHNHDNNPPDGSNWELLCLYCHDNEHARQAVADAYDTTASDRDATPDRDAASTFDHKPFSGLEALLKKMKGEN